MEVVHWLGVQDTLITQTMLTESKSVLVSYGREARLRLVFNIQILKCRMIERGDYSTRL